jgi:hypothetical protein
MPMEDWSIPRMTLSSKPFMDTLLIETLLKL